MEMMLGKFRLNRVLMLLIVAGFLSATGVGNPKTANRRAQQRAQLRQAEVAANRIVRRFHETLDFSNIFADEFVTEPRLRALAVSFDDSDLRGRFDEPTKERMYVVTMTFLHLWAEYKMVQNVNEVPPDVQKTDPRPEWFDSSNVKAPSTLSELNQNLLEVEKASALYRRYLPPRVFSGPIYLENIRSERKAEKNNFAHIPRIEWGNKKFGIPVAVPVFVVRPEFFDYYFIREKGVMKLFYVNILPDFRLF